MSLKTRVGEWLLRRELNNQVKERTMIGKIWQWFDGKKTIVGSAIGVLGYLAAGVPLVAPLCNENMTCLSHVASVGGFLLAAVGVAHKIYKFIYKTDVPK